jgi:hypothetical protein
VAVKAASSASGDTRQVSGETSMSSGCAPAIFTADKVAGK